MGGCTSNYFDPVADFCALRPYSSPGFVLVSRTKRGKVRGSTDTSSSTLSFDCVCHFPSHQSYFMTTHIEQTFALQAPGLLTGTQQHLQIAHQPCVAVGTASSFHATFPVLCFPSFLPLMQNSSTCGIYPLNPTTPDVLANNQQGLCLLSPTREVSAAYTPPCICDDTKSPDQG